jgi:PAS domain S-box-containing protein
VIYVLGVQSLFEVVAEQLPETREVLLVGGVADHDRELIREARKQLEENFSWDISEMSGIPPDEMAQKLSELSSDTVVLFTTYLSDSTGEYYIPRNVIGTLAEKSSVPIFALFDPMIDPGATGVGAVSFFDVGNRVGEVIERLYQGESPEEIGHITQSHLRLIFDDRKMRAYGLDSDTLPEDAVVLNSEKSIFETSPIATSFGIFMIVIQSCLIIALLWTRRRRLHAEGKTHEMKHYFSTVFMENPNPMAVVDMRDGVFRNINPAWEKLHGISRESAIGQTQFEVALVSGNSDATSRERFVVFKKNLSNYECCIRTGDGETHHVAFHSNSIDIAGESLQIVTMVDINDRVEAEKFRNSLMRDNRVTQLGQISAWIAHEINQPLGSILNNAEAALMQLDAQSISRDQLTEILADIKSDNRRASSVVERIRSMLGHHTISSEIVAVNTLIEEVSKMVKPEADRQNVYFKAISAMSSDAAVSVDHVLILQVFLNLISNAMEAVSGMPLSRRVVTLKCEILPDGKTIDFTLSDHGPGVPADKLDEIFNFFYTSKEIGLGLGLAISRSIVKESKGELFAENNPEGGACFHVRLPLLKQLL